MRWHGFESCLSFYHSPLDLSRELNAGFGFTLIASRDSTNYESIRLLALSGDRWSDIGPLGELMVWSDDETLIVFEILLQHLQKAGTDLTCLQALAFSGRDGAHLTTPFGVEIQRDFESNLVDSSCFLNRI